MANTKLSANEKHILKTAINEGYVVCNNIDDYDNVVFEGNTNIFYTCEDYGIVFAFKRSQIPGARTMLAAWSIASPDEKKFRRKVGMFVAWTRMEMDYVRLPVSVDIDPEELARTIVAM